MVVEGNGYVTPLNLQSREQVENLLENLSGKIKFYYNYNDTIIKYRSKTLISEKTASSN